MDSFKSFEQELKKASFFELLKTAATTIILNGVCNQSYYERGIKYGKMNLFPVAGDDVIWVAPSDIEVFWTEGGMTANKTKYFFRTKSGREFEVTEESWLRIMHGNEYRKPIAK